LTNAGFHGKMLAVGKPVRCERWANSTLSRSNLT
jgi:hypothetical protein